MSNPLSNQINRSDISNISENKNVPITSFAHASLFNGRVCNMGRDVNSIIGGPSLVSDKRSN